MSGIALTNSYLSLIEIIHASYRSANLQIPEQ